MDFHHVDWYKLQLIAELLPLIDEYKMALMDKHMVRGTKFQKHYF